jgi:hypothetical protein
MSGTEVGKDEVGKKYETAARPQQTRRLRYPRIWVGPQSGTVLRDREVEGAIGVRNRLSIAEQEREIEAVFGLQATGRLELLRAVVDPNHASPSAGQPGGDIGGPTAKLDSIEPRQIVWQKVEVGLRNAEMPQCSSPGATRHARSPDATKLLANLSQCARLRMTCSGRPGPVVIIFWSPSMLAVDLKQ